MKDPVKFDIPIYGGELWIMFGADFVQVGKSIQMDFSVAVDDCNAISFTKKANTNAGVYCIIIRPDKVRPDIIAHEAVHIANYVFIDRGVTINTKEDEHHAYFVGWIVQQIVYAAKLRKQNLSIRINGPHAQELNYGKKLKCNE